MFTLVIYDPSSVPGYTGYQWQSRLECIDSLFDKYVCLLGCIWNMSPLSCPFRSRLLCLDANVSATRVGFSHFSLCCVNWAQWRMPSLSQYSILVIHARMWAELCLGMSIQSISFIIRAPFSEYLSGIIDFGWAVHVNGALILYLLWNAMLCLYSLMFQAIHIWPVPFGPFYCPSVSFGVRLAVCIWLCFSLKVVVAHFGPPTAISKTLSGNRLIYLYIYIPEKQPKAKL